ncbi:nuclease-related domain-containing protein [Paraburkholderia sediminicola]|uniref:nuclease-related domain-containing protein n=1 Tax=Paraburkholderia sediminicola TaxID=458836 RepID=UPI0038BC493F
MTTLLILLTLAFFVYRGMQRRRKPTVSSPMPVTRSQLQGDAGEALVQDELRRVLTWLCGTNFYLSPTALLLNHAPGTSYPTAEVDHLAITPFGIFVIETKNWTGAIEPGCDADSVIRIGSDGRREERRSPLRQNRSKVTFLRAMLPGIWAIEGFGVFANDACALSAALPSSLIRRSDLGQWLRGRKSRHDARGHKDININAACQSIQSVRAVDPDGQALARHRALVRTNPSF